MKHIQQERLPLLVLEDQEAVLSMLFAADMLSEPLAQYLDYLPMESILVRSKAIVCCRTG